MAVSSIRIRLVEPVWPPQHIARPAAIGRPDNAIALHRIEYPGRPPVPEAQPPLERGCRSLAQLQHELDRVLVHRVVEVWICICAVLVLVAIGGGQVVGFVFRPRELFPVGDHSFDFLFGNERAMQAPHAPGAARRQEQHVTLTKQGLGTVRIQDGARIDSRRQQER